MHRDAQLAYSNAADVPLVSVHRCRRHHHADGNRSRAGADRMTLPTGDI